MAEPTPEQVKELQEKLKNMSPEELKQFQKQQCIFCQIVAGKVQSRKVYDDENVIAILDINPANPGHILLMPKEHYSIMPQMPDQIIEHIAKITKHLSASLLKALKVEGTTIFIANGVAAGQRAQHFMLHIIPRKDNDGLKIDIPSKKASKQDLLAVKKAISKAINRNFGVKSADEPEMEKSAQKKESDLDLISEVLQKPAIQDAEFEDIELPVADEVNAAESEIASELKKAEQKKPAEKKQSDKKMSAEKKPAEKSPKKIEKKPKKPDNEGFSDGKEVDLDDIANLLTGA